MSTEDADIVQASVLGLITVISLLGNIIICVVVLKHRWILYPTNDLVISLALLDILTAVIPLPLTIGAFITEPNWIFGKSACSVYAFFNGFLKYASILTLLFIAIHRYYRFVKPREYKETFTPGYTLIISVIIWIGSAFPAASPVIFTWAEYKFSFEYSGCLLTYKERLHRSVWNICMFVLFQGIPSFLIFNCYHLVYRAIGHRSNSRNRVTEADASSL
ncbi:hypothetical protein ACROYT_G007317 [Oculina patagonica]